MAIVTFKLTHKNETTFLQKSHTMTSSNLVVELRICMSVTTPTLSREGGIPKVCLAGRQE